MSLTQALKLTFWNQYFIKKTQIFVCYHSCVSNIIFDSTLVLPIVSSLVIIDFSLVEKTAQISLTHKITNVPNSQNTSKNIIFVWKSLIRYSLAISFKYQQENMFIPSCSLLRFWYLSLQKSYNFKKKKLVLADVPSCS